MFTIDSILTKNIDIINTIDSIDCNTVDSITFSKSIDMFKAIDRIDRLIGSGATLVQLHSKLSNNSKRYFLITSSVTESLMS
jgi:hypothetical protein